MKAAAYTRYSTNNQTENSIEYQLAKIREYCKENGIELIATYKDEAQSGTNTDRPGFQAMLSAAKGKEFDAVVVYDISRGSRDVGDWFTFRKTMQRLGISVLSATQKLGDIANGNDFLLELLSVGLGQREVLETRQKSIDGVAVKAKQGLFLGGTPPLGYDIEESRYVINPMEAETVQTIFAMYARGYSYNVILDSLDGALGKHGQPLGKNSLNSILKNERYVGVYTWNRRYTKYFRNWAGGKPNPNCVRIENCIPPIIDRETWEKVQKRMSDNKRNARNKATHSYLLSGLIECEECGAAYIGHTSTNTRGYSSRYYCCGNRYRTRSCSGPNVNADELEVFVVQGLKAYFLSLDFEAEARKIAEMVNGASKDLKKERAELAGINAKLANGLRAILVGGFGDFEELHDMMDQLRVRKGELEDIIGRRQASREEVDPKDIVKIFEYALEHWDDDLAGIIRQHISKITIHTDGSLAVNVGVHLATCGGET